MILSPFVWGSPRMQGYYTQCRLRLSFLDCVYALHCISAEWRRAISTHGDNHASDGQRFHWKVEVLKQVRSSDTRTD